MPVQNNQTSIHSIASLRLVRLQPQRAMLLWFAIHVFLAAGTGSPGTLGFRGSIILAATSGAVSWFDCRRRREIAFLGNLGVPALVPSAVAALTVLVLEAAAATAFALVRSAA